MYKPSDRLLKLPPYPFAEIDRKKKQAIAEGKDVISFGVGDPDQPTPKHIVEAGQKALENPKYHHYPFERGIAEFRRAVSGWYERRFDVQINPDTQIRACIGSKDGLSHAHVALINRGDVVLIPNPGYPVYNTGTILSDGKPYFLPLTEKNNFLPDLESVSKSILSKAKIFFINTPNNPCASVADEEYFNKIIFMAKKHKFIIMHDAAYSEIYFDQPPLSFLSVKGAADVGVEFHSVSKTYNMTGWRAAWVCGNSTIVDILGKAKDNYDSGVFEAIQVAAAAALSGPQECVVQMRRIYKERRDILLRGLRNLGWKFNSLSLGLYITGLSPF